MTQRPHQSLLVLNRLSAATRLASAFDAKGPLPACDVLADSLETTLNWASLDLQTGTYSGLLSTGYSAGSQRHVARRCDSICRRGESVSEALNNNESAAWASAYTFRRRIAYFWRLFEPRQPSDPAPWFECDLESLRRDPDIREALFSIHVLHLNRLGEVNEWPATTDEQVSERRTNESERRRATRRGPSPTSEG